ncbi:hypothetical protein PInf_005049 [Phytophthora infestans]|nr:hypothetical protein PInf_005049 [Phytophthora infestans]
MAFGALEPVQDGVSMVLGASQEWSVERESAVQESAEEEDSNSNEVSGRRNERTVTEEPCYLREIKLQTENAMERGVPTVKDNCESVVSSVSKLANIINDPRSHLGRSGHSQEEREVFVQTQLEGPIVAEEGIPAGGVELEGTDSETSLDENTSPEMDAKEIATPAEEPEITPSRKWMPYKKERTLEQLTRREYDEELEDRLFPLDEVEMKRRQDENAERSRELSLAELSTLLGVPKEKLERTRESSHGRLSTPEYWLEWHRKTLASTGAAKRANRNFKEEPSDRVGSVVATDSDGRDEGGGTDPKVFPLKEIKVETVHFPESSGSTPAEEPEIVDLTCLSGGVL